MMRAVELANGKTVEGIAFFGDMDTLPFPLDSPVWQNAVYWEMRGRDDAPAREKLVYSVRVELLRAMDDAPARENLFAGQTGYGWITRAM